MAIGFSGSLLHCGADDAQTGDFCGGTDPLADHDAIEAGFDVWRLSAGGDVQEWMLIAALNMHPNIARGIPHEPKAESANYPWPYPVGTFDDGSSGVYFTHR